MLTYINVSAEFVGVDPSFAVYLVSIVNAGSIAGRIFAGLLADLYGTIVVYTFFNRSFVRLLYIRSPQRHDTSDAFCRCHDVYLAIHYYKSIVYSPWHYQRVSDLYLEYYGID